MAINEALAEYLALYHKGEANAVTSRELECSFQMRGSELRREINALRGDGIPICSFEGGYYYAATAEELERTIRQLRSRIFISPKNRNSAPPQWIWRSSCAAVVKSCFPPAEKNVLPVTTA